MTGLIRDYEIVLEETDSPYKGTLTITYSIGITIKNYRLFKFNDGKQKVKPPVDCNEFVCVEKERLGEALAVWQGHELSLKYSEGGNNGNIN